MSWDFALSRRNTTAATDSSQPSPSVSRSDSAASTASTASIPIVYDSQTSRVESCDWKTFERTDDLLEAEAEGTSMTADVKINIGSAVTPIFAHFAYVDLSNLGYDVRRERRSGRINSVFIRV